VFVFVFVLGSLGCRGRGVELSLLESSDDWYAEEGEDETNVQSASSKWAFKLEYMAM